jgi:hypothetical protein
MNFLQHALLRMWNADWPAWIWVLLAAFGLWLVNRQMRMTREQMTMTQEQMKITQRQLALDEEQLQLSKRNDELASKQLELMSRRHVLIPTVRVTNVSYGVPTPRVRLRVDVMNTGDRTAKNFFWHVLIPTSATLGKVEGDGVRSPTTVDSITYDNFRGFHRHPTYPSREVSCAQYKLADVVENEFHVLVRLVAEDGAFPSNEGWTRLKIVVPPRPIVQGSPAQSQPQTSPAPLAPPTTSGT